MPADQLKVALQCGGSDGYSGVSANPALGIASDLVVRNGGTVILSETTETYGAEHLFTRRAVSREVGEKLVELMRWWEEYTHKHGAEINANPSPGNKAGGLTTIIEKSLGAMAKAGSTNLVEVIKYAEPVTTKGFVFMDTPGYDPVAATGQVAGGANLVCFTTGRGSVFGCKPAPSIKIATNTPFPAHGRGHGHQLRHDPRWRRDGAGGGPAHLRPHPAGRFGRTHEERVVRLRLGRVRALATRSDGLTRAFEGRTTWPIVSCRRVMPIRRRRQRKPAGSPNKACTSRLPGTLEEADRLLSQAQDMDPDAVAEVLREHDAGRSRTRGCRNSRTRTWRKFCPGLSPA